MSNAKGLMHSTMGPCHRVIAVDGSLGGYSGGLGIKSKLLELEQQGVGSLVHH